MAIIFSSFRQGFIQMSAPAKLLLFVLLIIISALLGSLLAVLVAMPVFNLNVTEITGIIQDPAPETVIVVKFFQVFQSVTMFIIPALIASWLFSVNTNSYLKTNTKVSIITLLLVIMSLPASVPVMNMITELNMKLNLPVWLDGLEHKMQVMEDNATRLTELFLVTNSLNDLFINFLMVAILPALGEEFIFRGILQRLLTEWTKRAHLAIFLSAFVFSFIHFQFYGFVPRFLLGLYFGYLFLWSGSIWVPVTGHLINNGMAVIYYHFAAAPVGETPLDTMGTDGNSNYIIYLSVFLTSLLVAMIYLQEKSQKESGYRNVV